jgi:site-specific recombinase XerD
MLIVKREFAKIRSMSESPSDATRQSITVLVDEWLAALRSANTRAAYALDLRRYVAWCESHDLDPLRLEARELRRYRSFIERSGVSSSTTARRLSAVASFGAYASGRGAAAEFAAVARPQVRSARAVMTLADADAAALLRAADDLDVRAGVLIRLLMLDGLKVGETTASDAADVSGRPPALTLAVGRRSVRLHPDTSVLLHGYLGRRREGPLLLSEGRARRTDRLSRFGIDYLVKEVATAAGLAGSVSGNTLRRRYVTVAHAEGVPIDAIRQGVGHADVRTTRRYLASERPEGPPR